VRLEVEGLADDGLKDLLLRVPVERREAAQQDVEDHAARPDVGLLGVGAAEHFGRHVVGRADNVSEDLALLHARESKCGVAVGVGGFSGSILLGSKQIAEPSFPVSRWWQGFGPGLKALARLAVNERRAGLMLLPPTVLP
jgi:hypothetical protein